MEEKIETKFLPIMVLALKKTQFKIASVWFRSRQKLILQKNSFLEERFYALKQDCLENMKKMQINVFYFPFSAEMINSWYISCLKEIQDFKAESFWKNKDTKMNKQVSTLDPRTFI